MLNNLIKNIKSFFTCSWVALKSLFYGKAVNVEEEFVLPEIYRMWVEEYELEEEYEKGFEDDYSKWDTEDIELQEYIEWNREYDEDCKRRRIEDDEYDRLHVDEIKKYQEEIEQARRIKREELDITCAILEKELIKKIEAETYFEREIRLKTEADDAIRREERRTRKKRY